MKTKEKKIKISALIDSGCMHTTIAADTVQREKLPMEKMKTTIQMEHKTNTGKSRKLCPSHYKQGDIQNKSMR